MKLKRTVWRVLLGTMLCVALLCSAATALATEIPNQDDYSASFLERNIFPKDHHPMADALHSLGLFKGYADGYGLDLAPNRVEALVTVIRLSGKEAEALAANIAPTFSDVPDWAAAYVGYGQEHGLVQGIGDNKLGSLDPVTFPQYATMLLRLLGYDDNAGEFSYEAALLFSEDIGLISEWALAYYQQDPQMLRNDMVYFMFQALRMEQQDADTLLLLHLVNQGAVSAADAYGSMQQNNESAAEIYRALRNGYSERWVKDLQAEVANNQNIPESCATVFKSCVYNWLKEAGNELHIQKMAYAIRNLVAEYRAVADDSYFQESANTLAYFQYPNKIVIRSDLNPSQTQHAIAHEFRHAVTSSMQLLVLEEGMTDYWIQEVDQGDFGYPYYYINLAKILAFLAGDNTFNQADLNGSYEELCYAIETRTGQTIDKAALIAAISSLNYESNLDQALADLQEQFLTMLDNYYTKNMAQIAANSVHSEYFVDTLIALGQLLYYPSSVIYDTESYHITNTEPSKSPASFYSGEFSSWVKKMIAEYSKLTEADAGQLQDYYDKSSNTRFNLKLHGPDAGSIFVKNADAYLVIYGLTKVDNTSYYYVCSFANYEQAKAFLEMVDGDRIETVSNAAFTKKSYQ